MLIVHWLRKYRPCLLDFFRSTGKGVMRVGSANSGGFGSESKWASPIIRYEIERI